MRAASSPRRLARPSAAGLLLLGIIVTLLGGCERKQRAREREAIEARAKAEAAAKEATRLAALPLPEEPPVELLRVPNSGLPCAVDAAFAAKCRRCHTIPTRHGAPFVFLTHADTQQERNGQRLSELIGRAVRTNFMPYRIDANPPILPLSDEEKQIILDWVDAGAPRDDCDPNAPGPEKAETTRIKNDRLSPPTRAKPAPSTAASR